MTFNSVPNALAYFQKLNLLKSKPNIKAVGLFYKKHGSESIGTSNYFYVQLKKTSDLNVLTNFCFQKDVQIVKQVPNMSDWYILSTKNAKFSTIELTNVFYESTLFENVDPAFMFNFINNTESADIGNPTDRTISGTAICANDPDFGAQWGLNNVGSGNYDVNACPAWAITQGSGIKVAVFDSGIEITHNDLQANIYPLSYNAETGNSPSNVTNPHGTQVAGIIGAVKDNALQIAGMAPQAQLMSVSHPFHNTANSVALHSAQLADGVSWAWQNGADVINNSWGDQSPSGINLGSAILENALRNAMIFGRNFKGSVVVFASGNEGFSNNTIRYPANIIPDLLTVGAVNRFGQRSIFSGYGNNIDVVAPGEGIFTTESNNTITSIPINGTSFAAPFVSGICALILAINPCLTPQQVRDIIEQTTIKTGSTPYTHVAGRPNGTWNNNVGYGAVNAHAAVLLAQNTLFSPTLDLMVGDVLLDTGVEPSVSIAPMWTSPEIWIRNVNDGGLTHENPVYSPQGNTSFINVRVVNRSCVKSLGTEKLYVYWANASTSLSWPTPWDGSVFLPNTTTSMGGQLPYQLIPEIAPGSEVIMTIPWNVPNPNDCGTTGQPWHFCLLARIVAANDPMAFNETTDLNSNVSNNNNIAWKNISVIDAASNNNGTPGAVVAVGNPFDTAETFSLELMVSDLETGKPIYVEAEIGIKMDDVLFNAWERGGENAQLLENTSDDNIKIVKGNQVLLENINFDPNELGMLQLDFNFLIKELTTKNSYTYNVIQKQSNTGNIIGGETFIINKNPRPIFQADAPMAEVDYQEAITIAAVDINEPALYNWYNESGDLVFQGKDLYIEHAVNQVYRLEVIATSDGYKDMTDVPVSIKPSVLESVAPNPVNETVQISYKLNTTQAAYIMVIGTYGTTTTSINHVLNPNDSSIDLNLINFAAGFYTIALVINGEIVDTSTLIKL